MMIDVVQLHAFDGLPDMTAPALHAFIALWGLLDCFFGLRIFQATARILMAFVGAACAASLALHFMPNSTPILIGACVAGLVAGFLVGWFVYKLCVVLIAFIAGYAIALPFLPLVAPGLAFVVPCCAGLVAALLALVIMEPVIIISTACTGALRLVFGAAFFMGGENLMNFAGGGRCPGELFAHADKMMLGIALALAIAGMFVQFHANRDRKRSTDKGGEDKA